MCFNLFTPCLFALQYNSNSSQHRSSRHTSSRSGYHGDRPDLCGVTTRWHLIDCGHRLGSVSPINMLNALTDSIRDLGGKYEWIIYFVLSDRFRTMINVLGDALAAGIMAHICKKDFEKAANAVAANAPPAANKQRVRRTISSCSSQITCESLKLMT